MNDADKKLLELAEVTAKRFRNRYVEDISEIKLRDDALVVLYAIPRLIAEKDALLARIERLRNVMSDQAIEFSKPSATTEALRKKWTEDVLAADDAAAKVQP